MGWNPRHIATGEPHLVSKPHGGGPAGVGTPVGRDGRRASRWRQSRVVTRWSPLLLLLGCAKPDPIAPESAVPVIVAILTAGADEHRLRAAWSVSPDAHLPGGQVEGVPVVPGELSLRVEGPGGVAPVVPVLDSAGTYRIGLAVVADAEYRLAGTIRGRPIAATVRVPGPITLIRPTIDTIALTEPGFGSVVVPYHVRSRGAAAVALITNPDVPAISVGDTVGVWYLSPGVFPQGHHPVTVAVYGTAMAAFLFREDWTSNIGGAVGVFGARAHRILTLRVP